MRSADQAKGDLQTIHTTGWLRIVAVNDTTAIAQIEHVCDGVIAGDYLEPFVAPPCRQRAAEISATARPRLLVARPRDVRG